MATAALAWFAKGIMLKRNKKLKEENEEGGIFYVH
jgi:hypothetical protein